MPITMSNVVLQSEEVTNLLVSPAQTSGSDDGGGGLFNAAGLAKLEKVVKVLVIRTIHRVFEPTMADLVQRVVRKELEEAQLKFLSSFKGNEAQTSNNPPRCLKLKFQQSVSDPVFTGKKIEGKGGCVLQVALLDDVTGDVVETGRESSAEIEIVALQDDDADKDNQEFDKYIKRVNNANKPLLVGKLRLKLNKGIGNLQNVKFSHGKDWMNNSEYKLGARVVGSFSGVVIKEGKTESFKVKDQRIQYNEKHDPPYLCDDVWRLKNISRVGKVYDRLKEQEVGTVEDFLVRLLRDSEQLKSILHIAPKRWKETVSHARRCKIDERVYYWYTDSQNTGVVFDLFGQVLGLVVQCQYRRTENLSMDEKANALKLKESGCSSHWEDIVKFSDEASFVQHLSNISLRPSDSLSIERHSDREVINGCSSYSPQDTTFRSNANAEEVSDAPIYSPSHNNFMSWMEGILNNDSSNIMFEDAISMFMPPQEDDSFPKVDALKHWRIVSLKLHALNHWRMVFKVVKFKRKRAETFDQVQKRHKSFDQDYACP